MLYIIPHNNCLGNKSNLEIMDNILLLVEATEIDTDIGIAIGIGLLLTFYNNDKTNDN